MKRNFATMLSLLLIAGCSSAQKAEKNDIPVVVKAAFEKQYPTMKDVDWEKEGDNYEAEFEDGETEVSVVYNASGTLLETETEIDPATLPKAIQDYLVANHYGLKVKEAAKLVYSDGSVKYEAEVKGKDLIFDEKGNLVKTIGK